MMLETISFISFFQDLTSDQIAMIKPLFEHFTCPANSVLFEQGGPAVYLYLLFKGEISIRYKPYDGPPITLTRLHTGDAFGWSAVVGSTFYTSSAVSETEIDAVRIRGKQLLNLVRENPETGKVIMDRIARMVSSRWKNAHAQVQFILNYDQK